MMVDKWDLTRDEMEAFAVESHERALRAQAEGRFDNEIVPINGVTRDEGPREPNWDKIRSLPTLTPDGKLTAAVASQISDGAAAMLIMNERRGRAVRREAARPHPSHLGVGRRSDHDALGADPGHPAGAREDRAEGDDIDLVEINEAFAPVPLAWMRETDFDHEKVNVNGGAIALGHPLGATGRPADDHAPQRARAHRWPLRPADHVRRRRPGQRHHHRTPLTVHPAFTLCQTQREHRRVQSSRHVHVVSDTT
jgi:acetyl-CoA C-acetyltransferase